MSTKKQEWVCQYCGLHGSTSYEEVSVLSVIRAIRDHHETLASQYAPRCHFDIDQVRVRNPQLMTIYEWNHDVAEIERKTEKRRTA